jgi:ABC-type multidrug transport system ATPase subunit
MVNARGLVKSFGRTRALTGLDLAVPAGTIVCLLGRNGAGKTTAVRVLTTLLRPDSGTALVAGHDVVARPARLAHAGDGVAVCPPEPAVRGIQWGITRSPSCPRLHGARGFGRKYVPG